MADRERVGRSASPTAAVLDSQSVTTTESGGPRGYDAGKKVKGRKRQALVDTDGRALVLDPQPADVHDRDGAGPVLRLSRRTFPFIAKAFADAGYAGDRLATTTIITALYRIEAEICGRPADDRRAARHERRRPVIAALEPWLREKLSLVSRESKLADAICYALSRWAGLSLFLDDGRVEIDSNIVERAIRPLALNRQNALFVGSDGGGQHWAVIASLVETCKLVGVEPQAYLTEIITRIVEGHPQRRLDDLLPWAYPAMPALKVVA